MWRILPPLLMPLLLQQPAEQAKLRPLPLPGDALTLALADCKALSPADRPFVRYLWVPSGEVEAAKVLSLALNMVGRGTVIQRPAPVQAGKILLLRVDLRSYAPRVNDLKEWLTLWEDFQFDPRFNLLLTKGALAQIGVRLPDKTGRGFVCRWKSVECTPYVWTDGKEYTTRWERRTAAEKFTFGALGKDAEKGTVELVRLPGAFLDGQARAELEALTGSQAPVVNGAYFLFRATSSIQDKGVYAVVYGGRYYQLAGIKKNAKKNATDEDVLLEDLGVGNVDKGITAKVIFDRLRSDQRAAVFRSQVTGMPRQMEFFRTLSARLDIGSGLISVTHDLKNQNIDIDQHPIANLLDFKDDAREVIWERPNGLHGYALFDGKGKLQDEAPPDVVKDHTIPAPHTGRLQSAISCIACHEAEGSDGWKHVTNDVKKLVGGKTKLDIFGDVSKADDAVADTLDRLAGLYQGDPERALQRGRDDYALAVLRSTGPWKESKGQTDVVKLAGARLVKDWRDYWYNTVDAAQALRELGIEADAKDARKVFATLVRPDTRAAVPVAEIGQVLVPEDPRIGALRAGLAISRADWDLSYSFAAERAKHNMRLLKEKK